MTTFGRYETTRDLFRGGLGTVSIARLSGKGGKDDFVVKSMHVGDTVQNRADAQRAAQSFLDRAGALQKLTEAKAKHWAPLHEMGSGSGGAFYVTDRYPRSLEGLIGGRVRLDGAALYNIVSSIVQGLREVQQACGRGHGELKPTNVMLDRVGQVDKARVILTDPAAKGSGNAGADETGDVQALGRLLYQLILFTPYRELSGWPIGESPAWSAIGRNGKKWRELCNRIINPGATPGSLTLESVEQELKPLRERKGKGGGGLIKVGAVLVLLAGAGAGLWFSGVLKGGGGGPVVPEEAPGTMWKEWHYGTVWLDGMASFDSGAIDAVNADPGLDSELKEALKSLREGDAGWKWSPLNEAGPYATQFKVQVDLIAVIASANAPGSKLSSREAKALAVEGGEAVLRIRRAILPERWPTRKSLIDAAARFEELGWPQAAAEARAVDQALTKVWSESDSPRLYTSERYGEIHDLGERAGDGLVGVVRAAPVARTVLERYEALDRTLVSLKEAGLPVDERVRPALRALEGAAGAGATGDQALRRLEDALSNVRSAADELLARVQAAEGGKAPPNVAWPEGPMPGGEGLADWLASCGGSITRALAERPVETTVTPLPDDARTLLASANGLIERLGELTERAKAIESPTSRAGFQGRVNDQREIVDQVRARVQGAIDGWARLDEPARAAFIAELADLRRRLDEGVRGTLEGFGQELAKASAGTSLRQSIAGVRNVSTLGLASVNAALEQQKLSLLDLHEADGNDDALRSGMQSLQEALAAIERPLTPEPAPSVLPRSLRGQTDAIRDALARAAARRRDAAAKAMIDDAQMSRGRPRDGFDPAASAAAVGYTAWISDVQSVLGDLAEAEGLMEGAYGPAEAGPGGRAWGDVIANAAARPAWADLEPLVAPVLARAAQLRPDSLPASIPEIESLAQNVADFPRALLAWRALVARDDWMRPDGLRPKVELYRSVRRNARSMGDPARATALVREIESGGGNRFREAVEQVTGVQQLDDARLYFDDFAGVASQLSARMRANLLTRKFVADADAALAQGGDDGALARRFTPVLEDYADGLADLGAEAPAGTSDWIARIRERMANEGSGAPSVNALDSVGPGARGWSRSGDSTVERVTYTRSDSTGATQRLVFRKLEGVGTPTQAVYLGENEVSVGMFRAIVEGSGGWDAFRAPNFWKELQSMPVPDRDHRNPRTWRFAGNTIQAGQQWIGVEQAGAGTYPAGFDPGKPGDSSPMQSVSIEAARLAAERAGCRLPSPGEFAAGIAMANSAGGATWNTRDAVFGTELEHTRLQVLEDARTQQFGMAVWPDSGSVGAARAALEVSDTPPTAGDATVPAEAASDGTLWFDPVDASNRGSVFANILGNVAEYGAMGADQTGVMGGSAVWPPELGATEAIALKSTPAALVRGRSFTDVGFRLAFDAALAPARQGFADRVRPVLGEPVYDWTP
ncbi:MAG: hypothetical protein IT439_01705 [Phycisphaerales bacterium]|nr:hypothetical protein [Phycisphaerales bacterium]